MSLQSYFQLQQRQTTVAREVVGGVTTFMALSYIIFVQPVVLGLCGMDQGAVMLATCICSALACLMMGLGANLPIALAPAMGHNFFFALTVCGPKDMGGLGFTWQEALAANFIAGGLFLFLSLIGLRQAIMNAIPASLKYAIAAGIGLLICFIGLQWSGIVVGAPATYVDLGNLKNPITLVGLFGLAIIAVLSARKVPGAILIGMLATAVVAHIAARCGCSEWQPVFQAHTISEGFPDLSATAGKLFGGFGSLFAHGPAAVILIIFTFLLLDVFDTIGTLVGVCESAGLMRDGQLPNARRAMLADASGTLAGTLLGTSTITSYIESSAGVAAGARTGLASVVTAILLLAAIFAYPLLGVFGAAVPVPTEQLGSHLVNRVDIFNTFQCYPVIAPVLIMIGCFMLPMVKHIDWSDLTEALPAFLTLVIMQLSCSITDGIAFGFIAYALLKLTSKKPRECPPVVYICSVLFVIYYIFRSA